MFQKFLQIIVKALIGMNRLSKKILIIIADYVLLIASFWISLTIRANEFYIPTTETYFLIFLAPLLAIPIYYAFGLYSSLIRYSNYQSIIRIMISVSIYTLLWFLVVSASGIVKKPYDFLAINFLVVIFCTGGIRYIARWFLSIRYKHYTNSIIYGAGTSGIQLLSVINLSNDMKVIAFIDDDTGIQGQYIEGKKVHPAKHINKLIRKNNVDEILLAIPSLSRYDKYQLLQSLKQHQVIIRSLPGFSDLAQGKVSVSDLKRINIEDLLRREVREPIVRLLKYDIENKNVLVTGAGGSIGSELCRQIAKLNPKSLSLYDMSEASLYLIERELKEINPALNINAILDNVTSQLRVGQIIKNFEVNTIYHTAAYKHVPIVEKNISAAVKCNIFGTLSCINAALQNNVDCFVHISTDKAVRPTNVMGATKRFAELILQAKAREQKQENKNKITRISMVRFGNVLGSSGSVVPLFHEQIKKGGPVTVTDPKMVRYFMTIPEAAQLVIQAGALGKSGEIFLLDMGEEIHVLDLAKDMIQLSGMAVKDEENPNGDIEIIFTGIRPGEKLYEELLINSSSKKTTHEKIMMANEEAFDWDNLKGYISEISEALDQEDSNRINEIFLKTVTGYKPRIH